MCHTYLSQVRAVQEGGSEDAEMGNISLLTEFSANSEYTSITFSKPRGWLLRLSARGNEERLEGSSESLRIDPRGCFFTFL
jgi:hypothetical protein